MQDNISELGVATATALLQGDCVVLPGLGSLSASRIPAFKEETDGGTFWHPPRMHAEWKTSKNYSPSVVDVVDPKTYGLSKGQTAESKKRTSKWIQFSGFDYDAIAEHISSSDSLPFLPVGHIKSDGLGFAVEFSAAFVAGMNAKFAHLSPVAVPVAVPASVQQRETLESAPEQNDIQQIEPDPADTAISIDTPETPVAAPAALAKPTAMRQTKPSHLKSRRSVSSVRANRNGSSKGALLLVSGLVIIIVSVILVQQWQWMSDSPSLASSTPVGEDSSAVSGLGNAIPTEQDSVLTQGSTLTAPDSSNSVEQDLPAGSKPVAGSPNNNGASSSTETIKVFTQETIGYTIIVRSALTKTVAEAGMPEMAHLNLPMGILEGESNGSVRFRMGVGVYPTASQAKNAIEELGNKLPEGSWVYRIR